MYRSVIQTKSPLEVKELQSLHGSVDALRPHDGPETHTQVCCHLSHTVHPCSTFLCFIICLSLRFHEGYKPSSPVGSKRELSLGSRHMTFFLRIQQKNYQIRPGFCLFLCLYRVPMFQRVNSALSTGNFSTSQQQSAGRKNLCDCKPDMNYDVIPDCVLSPSFYLRGTCGQLSLTGLATQTSQSSVCVRVCMCVC